MKQMMIALPLLITLAAACGGADRSADPVEVVEAPIPDPTSGCQDSATLAREAIATEIAAASPATLADAKTRWSALTGLLDNWKAPSHPCSAAGPKVAEREEIRAEVITSLEQAADGVVARALMTLKDTDLPGAIALLTERYVIGTPATAALKEAASGVAQAHEAELYAKFEASKEWARTGQTARDVVCIFGKAALDPKAPLNRDFFALYEGAGDVHALCLIPLPADKWAGDPAGQVVMELHVNGRLLSEMELGAPEKWANTRYFRGRFGLPQGVGKGETAAYSVVLTMRRPKLGNESLSSGQFFWHK